MARSTWVKGCGIGCAVVVVIVAIGAFGLVHLFQNMADEFEQIETVSDELTARYGRVREFTPEPDGRIPTGRIELFLEIRESTSNTREELEEILGELSAAQEGEGSMTPGRIFGLLRSGVAFLPRTAEYYQLRNQALLDAGMGLGEYLYLYAVGYYSWLGHSPGSGPAFVVWDKDEQDEERDDDRDGFGIRSRDRDRSDDPDAIRAQRDRRIRERLSHQLLPVLRNQLLALEATGDADNWGHWPSQLAAENDAMQRDPAHLPWEDGLPAPLLDSLTPFTERFEASWSELCNPIETMTQQD